VAQEYLPSNIYQLDSKFAHHVILVEKSTHTLHLYENLGNQPKLIKTYKIATGKIKGNKQLQGDKKTPEGIYQFQNFHSNTELKIKYGDAANIYGAGAFTLNYPNDIDRRAGKTGGGIWLHSTDNDARVSKGLDSKGCVVAIDLDLKDISKYIDLQNTSVIIVQDVKFLHQDTWTKNKNEIQNMVSSWADAWKTKDFNAYISQYSKEEFKHNIRGNFYTYKNYKRAVFARKDQPQIEFSNISILNFDTYAVVSLEQDYKSAAIQDIGKKILYLKRNAQYEWKIVSEHWSKLPIEPTISFTPKMRFFQENQQAKNVKNDSKSI